MKDEVREIIGKTIAGVVIKEHVEPEGHPNAQLFLLFKDGTYYEFYSHFGPLSTTGGVCRGTLDDVLDYMGTTLRPVWVAYRSLGEE